MMGKRTLATCAMWTMAAAMTLGNTAPQAHPTPQADHAPQPPLSPQPQAIAERVATQLETYYLYPEQGQRYAAHIRERASQGAYNALSGMALANALTRDLTSIGEDRHLYVRAGGPPLRAMPPRAPSDGQPRDAQPSDTAPPANRTMRPRSTVPAIEQPGWIAPGVAYIRFNEFPDDPAVTDAVTAFMAAHSEATTLIFDLRTTRGGTPAQMDVIFPYLFDRPMPLARMASRPGVPELAPKGATLRPVAGAPETEMEYWVTPGADTPLRRARVYVLTAYATASAAEMFAAAMQWSGRARVIGMGTAGANHFGFTAPLGGDLTLFVPVGRTYNPATGQDWEGTGITPDIAVAPGQALTRALMATGMSAEQAQRLNSRYIPNQPMIPPPMMPIE